MIAFLFCISFAEPSASLFVEANGNFFLNVTFQEEWSKAEFYFDQPFGYFSRDNLQQFSYEGNFDSVPSVLNMTLELSKENIGQAIDLPIPVVYLPYSQPSLAGENALQLPKYTFRWHLYHKIVSPIQKFFHK